MMQLGLDECFLLTVAEYSKRSIYIKQKLRVLADGVLLGNKFVNKFSFIHDYIREFCLFFP